MGDVMYQFIGWLYGQAVAFLGEFFSRMGGMGIELFEMSWVQSIILFFSYLAWAQFVVELVVSVFETGIEYQNGRIIPPRGLSKYLSKLIMWIFYFGGLKNEIH